MKKVFFLLLAVGVVFVSCKKDDDEDTTPVPTKYTITSDDFASAGAIIRQGIDTTNLTGFDLDTTGEGRTWNFAAVGSDKVDTITFLAPANTPGGALYGANLAVRPSKDSQMYIYLNKATDKIEQVGLYIIQDVGGALDTLTAAFSDAGVFMRFPASFGTTLVDNSLVTMYTSFVQGVTVYVKSDMNSSVDAKVDASGTITTPLGQFQCIREFRKDIITNTVYTSLTPGGPWTQLQQSVDTNYTYNFITKGKGYTILEVEVDKNDVIKEIRHML
jgi:hypothetical protein